MVHVLCFYSYCLWSRRGPDVSGGCTAVSYQCKVFGLWPGLLLPVSTPFLRKWQKLSRTRWCCIVPSAFCFLQSCVCVWGGGVGWGWGWVGGGKTDLPTHPKEGVLRKMFWTCYVCCLHASYQGFLCSAEKPIELLWQSSAAQGYWCCKNKMALGSVDPWVHRPLDPSNLRSIRPWIHWHAPSIVWAGFMGDQCFISCLFAVLKVMLDKNKTRKKKSIA